MEFSHLVFDKILRLEHGHAAMLHAVAYLVMLPPPVETLVRTFEVCLLQYTIQKIKKSDKISETKNRRECENLEGEIDVVLDAGEMFLRGGINLIELLPQPLVH